MSDLTAAEHATFLVAVFFRVLRQLGVFSVVNSRS